MRSRRRKGATMRPDEIAAAIHADMCNDNRNGYSWSPRWGGDSPYGSKTIVLDGHEYTYKLGSYDCSSSVLTAWRLALQYTEHAGQLDDAYYTGNMLNAFLDTGLFEAWNPYTTSATRGDVYLNIVNHTAMCQDGGDDGVYGYDCLSEFCMSETGDVYNNQVGDQTGWESYIHDYYDYPWDVTLHYAGGDIPYAGEQPPVPPTPPVRPAVHWQVKQEGEWQPVDYCGKRGVPIQDIRVDFDGNGWYQVVKDWSGQIVADGEESPSFDESPVLAVRCYYETPDPSATGYFEAKYRVSELYEDWFDWQYDDDTWNGQDGYAGDFKPIDRFEITLA